MVDVAKRTKAPPTQARSHPKGTPKFVVAEILGEDTQAAHDAAHQKSHREAALVMPGFFCQTCGVQVGCRYHVQQVLKFLKRMSVQK